MTVSTLALLVLLGAGLFSLLQRHLSGAWFSFGVHPQILELLELSLEDQKVLARERPEQAHEYRQRFDSTREIVNNLKILQRNRESIIARYEVLVLAILGGTLVLSGGVWIRSVRRNEGRLKSLQKALVDLSLGHTGVATGEHRRDTIGRIAAMIERTSRRIADDRHRLASLRHLDTWQEAARRQAHEMRTPLTAVKLKLSRLQSVCDSDGDPGSSADVCGRLVEEIAEELSRLEHFAWRFSSFARLTSPKLVKTDLGPLLAELCELYENAWPNLSLHCESANERFIAMVDPAMLRQVVVNLCENSSLALGEADGSVVVSVAGEGDGIVISIRDDGPGVKPSICSRVLEPYVTTRAIGEGSGLGLAISRKIMLDHGGDLELAETSPQGTVFRIVLPASVDDEAGS